MNAIIIAFAGRCKMIDYQEHGIAPYGKEEAALPSSTDDKGKPWRWVDPKTLPRLTPAAFDAMFPGKPSRGPPKLGPAKPVRK